MKQRDNTSASVHTQVIYRCTKKALKFSLLSSSIEKSNRQAGKHIRRQNHSRGRESAKTRHPNQKKTSPQEREGDRRIALSRPGGFSPRCALSHRDKCGTAVSLSLPPLPREPCARHSRAKRYLTISARCTTFSRPLAAKIQMQIRTHRQ